MLLKPCTLLFMFLCIMCTVYNTGCASVASLAQTLNARHDQACITFSGAYGMFLGIHGVLATGGVSMADCVSIR